MRNRVLKASRGFSRAFTFIGAVKPGAVYALLLAFGLQSALPACASEPHSASLPSAALPSPAFPSSAAGPTETELRAAFSGRALRQVDPETFNRYAALHAGQGRLLAGAQLAAVVAAASAPPARSRVRARPPCDSVSLLRKQACEDSLRAIAGAVSDRAWKADDPVSTPPRDSAAKAHTEALDSMVHTRPDAEPDETSMRREEAKGWFANLFVDLSDGHGGGGGGSGGDWAAVIYVVVGVVVVGAFLLYGVQTLYNLITNQEDDPLFMETGLRISYSGKALDGASGAPRLYRDAYLAGLRFAIGLDKPVMGMGLGMEGGYIDVRLRDASDPQHGFDFQGGYLVAGPMLRFGHNDPLSFNLEFLNGTSSHASIGWISKSRMTLEGKVSPHVLIGAHLGAVFYDLHFLDGLGWRSGDFNRDLSLIYGLDAGWAF